MLATLDVPLSSMLRPLLGPYQAGFHHGCLSLTLRFEMAATAIRVFYRRLISLWCRYIQQSCACTNNITFPISAPRAPTRTSGPSTALVLNLSAPQ